MIAVRTAVQTDADAIGEIHVRAWQRAYAGLMPDDYLASLVPGERAEMWRRALGREPRPRVVRLVVERRNEVVGFAIAGPEGGNQDAEVGELYAINVDPSAWGAGAGVALHSAALAWLETAGFSSAILWVHPDNARAIRFYEREHWVCDDVERVEEVLDVEVPEVRYSRVLVRQG